MSDGIGDVITKGVASIGIGIATALIQFVVIVAIIVAIIVIIAIYLIITGKAKKVANSIFIIVGLALFQTAIFGLVIFIMERLDIIWIVVEEFNRMLITPGEVGLVAFIVFLFVDIIGEFIRYLVLKIKQLKMLALRSLVVSIIQVIILIMVLSFLSTTGILTLYLYDGQDRLVPEIAYWIVFWMIIFIAEVIIELIRIQFEIEI